MDMDKTALLIMNPRAGHMQGKRYLGRIISLFASRGYSICVHWTRQRGDGTILARDYSAMADLVIAMGGDGTMNEVLEGMIQSGTMKPFGFIPAGSTNVISKNLHFPKNIMKAVKCILDGSPYPFDLGSFNRKRHFAFIASFGVFTKASYDTPQQAKNAFGTLAYLIECMKELPAYQPIHARVEIPGEAYEGDYIFAAFTNSLTISGFLKLDVTPGNLNDGMMEILLVKHPASPKDVGPTIQTLTRREYDSRYVTFCSAPWAKVTFRRPVAWTIDGEYADTTEKVEIETLHNAVEFLHQ